MRSSSFLAVACEMLVSLVILHLALFFFPCCQAQDALHHGRYGSEVQLCRCCLVVLCLLCATTGASGLEVQKTASSPQLHFYITVVDISVVVQRLISMVLATMEFHQLCLDRAVDAPGMQVVLFWSSSIALCILQSLYCVRCSPLEYKLWTFLGHLFRIYSVFNTLRFDSGYMFGVGSRGILEEFHTSGPSYFSAMLGSTSDSCLCVRLRRLVLFVTLHLALCSLPRGAGP